MDAGEGPDESVALWARARLAFDHEQPPSAETVLALGEHFTAARHALIANGPTQVTVDGHRLKAQAAGAGITLTAV